MIDEPDIGYKAYEAGREAMGSGDYLRAVEEFQSSVRESPHFKTLELLGECYMKLGRFRDAVVPLAAAATLNNQVRAPALLAKALLEIGEGSRAREIAQDVLTRADGNKVAIEVLNSTTEVK